MLAGCPVCSARYRLDERRIGAAGIKLRCGTCRTIFRVRGVPTGSVLPQGAVAVVPPRPLRVLVAHDSATSRSTVAEALAAEPFAVSFVSDGPAAYAAILDTSPDVAILDVALPGMFGFEICEAVRRIPGGADVKIILIASIFDKTKYKRAPVSLYGADDYIEKHHIPDELALRIYRLLAMTRADGADDTVVAGLPAASALVTGEVAEAAAAPLLCRELRHDEDRPDFPAGPASERDKAGRLARSIVSDIVLYNQPLVEEGVRTGMFSNLLAEQLAEGRALYEQRVTESVRSGTSYFDDAVAEVVERIRADQRR
ncbi:hypothetical protein GURASL_15050 [Geotalea uraniireducens]|uniref:Response regulatory domain-containing protein n=2 Tax=Geotalea uraniireducens TaxID=351604 RepID=A0ABN6VWF6_9BACT|nr:hypothetical protein GURASL_15050 [Geotalea uraniireducens]